VLIIKFILAKISSFFFYMSARRNATKKQALPCRQVWVQRKPTNKQSLPCRQVWVQRKPVSPTMTASTFQLPTYLSNTNTAAAIMTNIAWNHSFLFPDVQGWVLSMCILSTQEKRMHCRGNDLSENTVNLSTNPTMWSINKSHDVQRLELKSWSCFNRIYRLNASPSVHKSRS